MVGQSLRDEHEVILSVDFNELPGCRRDRVEVVVHRLMRCLLVEVSIEIAPAAERQDDSHTSRQIPPPSPSQPRGVGYPGAIPEG